VVTRGTRAATVPVIFQCRLKYILGPSNASEGPSNLAFP